MDTKSWHYRIWKWSTLALEPRSFQLPTRVNVVAYWLTVAFSPFVALLWLGRHLLILALLALAYVLITLVNLAVLPFGRVVSYTTAKPRRYRPLLRIYRQQVYPIHLLCALGMLSLFVGLNYLFIFSPEGRDTSLLVWIALDVAFNLVLLCLSLMLLSTQRLGKRLNAYLRYTYRRLPTYSFDREPPVNATN